MKNVYLIRLQRSIFLFDFVVLNVAMLIAHFLIFANDQPSFSSEVFIVLANICWVSVSLMNKNYKISRPFNINEIIDKFLMTFIYQSLVLLGAIYFFKILNISRGFVMITLVGFFSATIIQRIWLTHFLGRLKKGKYLAKKALVLGDKQIADSLISAFSNSPELGYESFEFFENQHNDLIETALDGILSKSPDEVFVCYKEMKVELLDKLILFGEENCIKIRVVFDSISGNYKNRLLFDDLPILHIDSVSEASLKIKVIKRSFDILFASVLMIIGSPIFLLLYLVTKTTSKGKAFYKQERIGKNEKPFYIYKFRSMYSDSEKFGPQLSKDNDPRITKWGRFMRKTRLDELPQFWNVLRGEMSIVGYRPERKHFIEEISRKRPEYKNLLNHKPGITSMGQVHYGYAENVDQMCERLRYDLLYFRNINLNSDVKIILKTVKVMVQGKGK